MKRLLLCAAVSVIATISTVPSHASGTGTGETESNAHGYSTTGQNGGNGDTETTNQGNEGLSNAGETAEVSQLPPGEWVQSHACETVSALGCVETYTCSDGSTPVVWVYHLDSGGTSNAYSQCPEDPPPHETTTVVDIPGEVVRAFKEVRLPESTITIQPPGGKTLVNLPTIMSTKAQAFTKTVNLEKANVTITLDIVPTNFTWNHGDKTSQSTTEPGGMFAQRSTAAAPMCSTGGDPFPCITHTYVTADKKLGVSVDTTWSATYQVNGTGPWKEVDDTVTIVGAAQELAVLEAKPQLVLN